MARGSEISKGLYQNVDLLNPKSGHFWHNLWLKVDLLDDLEWCIAPLAHPLATGLTLALIQGGRVCNRLSSAPPRSSANPIIIMVTLVSYVPAVSWLVIKLISDTLIASNHFLNMILTQATRWITFHELVPLTPVTKNDIITMATKQKHNYPCVIPRAFSFMETFEKITLVKSFAHFCVHIFLSFNNDEVYTKTTIFFFVLR